MRRSFLTLVLVWCVGIIAATAHPVPDQSTTSLTRNASANENPIDNSASNPVADESAPGLKALPPAPAAPNANRRVALVVGNANYLHAPLKNPRNDASAMAELLRRAGFEVEMYLDTNLKELQAAVDAFGHNIRNPDVKFALFYYAGHGGQQNWRNYIIPVSAHIRTAADIPVQTVDLSHILRYMSRATGRSHLLILDACRDNPFGDTYKPKPGLSQFDAPGGSLLAYATAPGQFALDGNGDNGLYTGYLLKEFAKPDQRIEDAFKRVRLNVRMETAGRQIPWESTSLEDDVFMFPVAKKSMSESDKDTLLEREIFAWLRVKNSADPKVLANFIREFPSGSISELAQSKLNRLLAVSEAVERRRQQQAEQAVARVAAQRAATQEREAQIQAEAARARQEAAERFERERQRKVELALAAQAARTARMEEELARKADAARLLQERALAAKAQVEQDAALRKAAKEEAQRFEAERKEQARVASATERAAAVARAEAAKTALRERETQLAVAERQAALERKRMLQQQPELRAAQAALQLEQVQRAKEEAAAQEQKRLAEQALREQDHLALLARQQYVRLVDERKQAQSAVTATEIADVTIMPTPYFRGFSEHRRRYAVGDVAIFNVIDVFTKAAKTLSMRVTQADDGSERVVYNDGEFVSDLMGNITTNQRGSSSTPRQFYPAELFVGKKWQTRFKQDRPNGTTYTFDYKLKVVAKETVTVPAGTFEAFRIEATGFNIELGASLERTIWVAPGINADIAHEIRVRLRNGQWDQNDRQELASYAQVHKD